MFQLDISSVYVRLTLRMSLSVNKKGIKQVYSLDFLILLELLSFFPVYVIITKDEVLVCLLFCKALFSLNLYIIHI